MAAAAAPAGGLRTSVDTRAHSVDTVLGRVYLGFLTGKALLTVSRQANPGRIPDPSINTGGIDDVKIDPEVFKAELLALETRAVELVASETVDILASDGTTVTVQASAQDKMRKYLPHLLRFLRVRVIAERLEDDVRAFRVDYHRAQDNLAVYVKEDALTDTDALDAFIEGFGDAQRVLPEAESVSEHMENYHIRERRVGAAIDAFAYGCAAKRIEARRVQWHALTARRYWPELIEVFKPELDADHPVTPGSTVAFPNNRLSVIINHDAELMRADALFQYGRDPRLDTILPVQNWKFPEHHATMPSVFLLPASRGTSFSSWPSEKARRGQLAASIIVTSFPKDAMLAAFPHDDRLRAFYLWYDTIATQGVKYTPGDYIEPFSEWYKKKVARKGLKYAAALAAPGPSHHTQPPHVREFQDSVRREVLYSKFA